MEEGVEIERDVGKEEGGPGVRVGSNALEQSQSIADSIRLMSSENRGVNGRIDVDYLLQ